MSEKKATAKTGGQAVSEETAEAGEIKITKPNLQALDSRRIEEFTDLYANNVQFESTLWDLKLIFGQVEQSLGPNVILQHTSITMPWPQIKMMSYLLQVNLLAHESQFGRIPLKQGLVNQIPENIPEELKSEASPEMWSALRKLWGDFVAANPELAPKR